MLPEVPPAEVIGKQLSDRQRDPVFRTSMQVAQVMGAELAGLAGWFNPLMSLVGWVCNPPGVTDGLQTRPTGSIPHRGCKLAIASGFATRARSRKVTGSKCAQSRVCTAKSPTGLRIDCGQYHRKPNIFLGVHLPSTNPALFREAASEVPEYESPLPRRARLTSGARSTTSSPPHARPRPRRANVGLSSNSRRKGFRDRPSPSIWSPSTTP